MPFTTLARAEAVAMQVIFRRALRQAEVDAIKGAQNLPQKG